MRGLISYIDTSCLHTPLHDLTPQTYCPVCRMRLSILKEWSAVRFKQAMLRSTLVLCMPCAACSREWIPGQAQQKYMFLRDQQDQGICFPGAEPKTQGRHHIRPWHGACGARANDKCASLLQCAGDAQRPSQPREPRASFSSDISAVCCDLPVNKTSS